jgi:hypothetical protein
MPPLLAWTIAILGAAALVRLATKHSRRVNDDLDALRTARANEPVERERMPKLKRDPVSGVYRPD